MEIQNPGGKNTGPRHKPLQNAFIFGKAQVAPRLPHTPFQGPL